MPLTFDQQRECERQGPDNVRRQLAYAGANPGSVVPGLGDGTMTRGDVQEWLAEIERKSAEEQKEATASTLFWAKVAAWAGIIGIVVTIVIALLGRR
jgi:hypothetical protein